MDKSGLLLAIHLSSTGKAQAQAINFFTPDTADLQVAKMQYRVDKEIPSHIHNKTYRLIKSTSEVLVINRGKIRADFFAEDKKYIRSVVVSAGDILVLLAGGHGFTVLEDCEIIEVKQGPYLGQEADKTKFPSFDPLEAVL